MMPVQILMQQFNNEPKPAQGQFQDTRDEIMQYVNIFTRKTDVKMFAKILISLQLSFGLTK